MCDVNVADGLGGRLNRQVKVALVREWQKEKGQDGNRWKAFYPKR